MLALLGQGLHRVGVGPPALLWKAAGLRSLGRDAEADAAQALAEQRQHQGQWLVGE